MFRVATALAITAGAVAPALANDATAELPTGGLRFRQNDNVEMRAEVSRSPDRSMSTTA
jgi:hypothetical protein